jgi:hypothetical protein
MIFKRNNLSQIQHPVIIARAYPSGPCPCRKLKLEHIARAPYAKAIGRRVVVVRAFVKKTQRTPRAEIDLALRRAKDIT